MLSESKLLRQLWDQPDYVQSAEFSADSILKVGKDLRDGIE